MARSRGRPCSAKPNAATPPTAEASAGVCSRQMDVAGKSVLVLGGYGLVGQAVARRLIPEAPRRIVLLSLRREEAEEAVEDLVRDREEFESWILTGGVPRLRASRLASYFTKRQRLSMPLQVLSIRRAEPGGSCNPYPSRCAGHVLRTEPAPCGATSIRRAMAKITKFTTAF